jgi:XTP/dITP diphosphohydrolase
LKLCFATNNQHKIEEVKSLTGNRHQIYSLRDIGCDEELAEDQNTLEGNSWQKAKYVFEKFNIACFADDTGLEVEALEGKPGVDTAHYSGTRDANSNMNLLLENLQNITNRSAQFRTVITFVTPTITKQFEGIVKGDIAKEKKGTEGFGYDPIFIPLGQTKSLAEMSLNEKNKISHRALAMEKLIEYLKAV